MNNKIKLRLLLPPYDALLFNISNCPPLWLNRRVS